MKKLITILAVVFSTTCFAQTIPSASENNDFRLEYKGYTTYCNIGYIVGLVNYTDTDMDILVTWANGSQLVHLPAFYYDVFWFPGAYVENSKIRARVVSNGGTPPLAVKVLGNYYF